MIKRAACALLTAAVALALAACATPSTTAAPADWNRPFVETPKAPVFLHDMAIANPPHPQPLYANYTDEPTRFEFHPRNMIYDEPPDNSANADTNADTGDMSGGTLENGILYVDPNQ